MILIVFCAYLLVLLGIGAYCARQNRSLSDFILGGRRLSPWVAAISAQASDMSSWLLVGLPGMAYAFGFSILWACIGCTAGTVFNWLVVAPRLRALAGKTGSLTVPDLLEAKLARGRSPLLRTVAVLTILIFYTHYIAAQFIAAGEVSEATFQDVTGPWGTFSLTYKEGLLIGGGIIVAYTIVGGFLAVSYTDVLQGLLMVVAVVLLPIVGLLSLPEGKTLIGALTERNPALLSVTGGKAGESLLFGVIITQGLAWGLGYPGQPHILARFMALRDNREMKRAALIGIVWVLLALYGAFFVGIIGVGHADLPVEQREHIMPLMARTLLPPVVHGILIAAAVAAMMSTVDSQMIIAVGAINRDILEKLFGIKPSPKASVRLARLVALIMGGLGILIALWRETVFEKVLDAWGGLAAGLGPAVLLTLFWKRTHRVAVVAGMIAGVTLVHVWDWIAPLTPCPSLGSLVPGFLLNLVLVTSVSPLLSPRQRQRS